jgi:hypothetical protein
VQLIIGGLGARAVGPDIENLVAEAGLGQVSKSTVSQITQELRARYHAFRARGLGEVELLVLFCDRRPMDWLWDWFVGYPRGEPAQLPGPSD